MEVLPYHFILREHQKHRHNHEEGRKSVHTGVAASLERLVQHDLHPLRVLSLNVLNEGLGDPGLVLQRFYVVVPVVTAREVLGPLPHRVLVGQEPRAWVVVFEAVPEDAVPLRSPGLDLGALQLFVLDNHVQGVNFELDGGLHFGGKLDEGVLGWIREWLRTSSEKQKDSPG